MRSSTPGWSRTVTDRTWRETLTRGPPWRLPATSREDAPARARRAARSPGGRRSRRHLLAHLLLGLLVADDHLVDAGAGGHHRPHLLRLVDVEGQEDGPVVRQGPGHDLLGLLAVEDVEALDAVRLGELGEVGVRVRQVDLRVALGVEQLLPLPDHP